MNGALAVVRGDQAIAERSLVLGLAEIADMMATQEAERTGEHAFMVIRSAVDRYGAKLAERIDAERKAS